MLAVARDSWALFLGLLLLMAGNALQGAALGVRAVSEEFGNDVYGVISAGYFAGFLLGAHFTPKLLARVGHIRVFAALASLVSAAFILFAAVVDPVFWFLMRVLVGFGFSGVYIVAESWLNSVSNNETRGTTLSLYMFVQFTGVVLGQQMLNLGDPSEYALFVLMSVMVSLSFAPILLSVTPAPVYQTAKPMSVRELVEASPLGAMGSAFIGCVYGVMFGMGAVYGGLVDMTVAEIALLLTLLYLGGALLQVPIGWLSDRMDRRQLVVILAVVAAASCLVAMLAQELVLLELWGVRVFAMMPIAFIYGACVNPMYGLLVAHTNDYLENDQMAAAAGRFVFLNGCGALVGPVAAGQLMNIAPGFGFWGLMGALTASIGVYGVYRMTQRATVSVDETAPYTPISRTFSSVAAEMAQEVYIERAEAAAQDEDGAASEVRGAADDAESEERDDERRSRAAVDGG